MNYRGWMFIGFSREYPKGKIKARTFMNEECLVFRSNSGKLNMVEPYCSHFGVNMTTGRVVKDSILCPMHGRVFHGDGSGAIVRPGNARESYLVRRLFGLGTERVQMPLGVDADNPTEVNPPLSREQMWVVMSWINCMDPAAGPHADIDYDCAANADNDGTWR